MFKLLKKVKHNKKGFTLVELMTTVALMSIVIVLIGQLSASIYKKYEVVERQFALQSQIEYVAAQFQKDAYNCSLATATNVDLFYEDPSNVALTKKLSSCSELGTFTETSDGTLTFENGTDLYTYYFTYNGYFYSLAPERSTDDNGNYVKTENRVARKFTHVFDDEYKMDVSFSVGLDAFELDADTKQEAEKPTNVDGTSISHNYLDNGITVTISSDKEYLPANYVLNTCFSFDNMATKGQKVNVNSADGYYLTSSYTAGWDAGTNAIGYPSESVKQSGVAYPNITKTANIIRFISYTDSLSGSLGTDTGGTGANFTCGTRFLMAGSDLEYAVVDTLRNFRDNTLRGTAIGEFIIDRYYNVWSPAIIGFGTKSETFKSVARTVVTDAAYLVAMSEK